ncbi:MAG: hypothetical protein A2005_09175 [Desulfuromonadales bacterium GWC2_61_20]|nr:MAG: hypothetical protein A2005_09175 [Desulfuromonadales bacterium GWC2_61_20]OGW35412.1 MAG: hypothetical protein A2010_11095 [Nitrospirae bacterium GWD2_57_9]HAD04899.1 GMP synthase [Desulfuromonas sp.]HBT82039.1 GMP synthase [Desulfuromonas sp.]
MITIIQSDPQVPAGVFAAYLEERHILYRTVRLYAGEALPPPSLADAIIVLGGNMGVDDERQYPFLLPLKVFMRSAVDAGGYLLGICLGGQLLAAVAGGRCTSGARGEKGLSLVNLTAAATANDPLLAGLPQSFYAFQWHNDSFDPPPAATLLASSAICPGQAFRFGNAWGVQFHPEVDAVIVADWCGRVASAQSLARAFADAEAEHQEMAVRLLGNFLAAAGELPAVHSRSDRRQMPAN